MYIIWMEGSSETTPKIARQILYKTTRQMLTCGNLENINQILTLCKSPKLMHHGHQSFYCLCHRVFLCNVRSRKNLGIKNISFFPSRFMFGYSRVSIQLPMTARVKILKIWWTSSLCKLSGNTLFKLQPLLLIHFPFSKIVVLNSNLTKAKFS